MKVTVRASEALLTTPPTSTLHSLRSVNLSGSQACVLFAATDVTINLLGSTEDVHNEPRKTTGEVMPIPKYCPSMFTDYWNKNEE